MTKFLSLLFFLSLLSCGSQKNIDNTNYIKINFGDGGGITGAVEKYTLEPDGKVYYQDSLINHIDNDKLLRRIFTNAGNLKDYDFKDRGNIYSFIELENPTGKHLIIWKPRSKDLSPKVKELYKQLKSTTKPRIK